MLNGMSPPVSPRFRWLPVATVAVAALAAALWLTVHPAIAARVLAEPAQPAEGPRPVPAATGTRPQAEAEFNRVVELMAYTQAAQRFQALRAQGVTTPELLALARQLDGGLPQRVARHEVSPEAAQALHAALREVLGTATPLP